MNEADLKNTINELFQLFQKGNWDRAATLFSKEAKITRQYGERITTNTVEEFILSLKSGPLSHVGLPEYTDRKISLLKDGGFVERHTTQLRIKGQLIKLPVCIIGTIGDEGKISTLEEYLDPSPIIRVLTQAD